MVTRDEAKFVFKRTFSRPFRLLFGNPVCAMFSLYYSYIYGTPPTFHSAAHLSYKDSVTNAFSALIYLFLVSIPFLFGSPPFSRMGLFAYNWPLSTLSLAYVGLGESKHELSTEEWMDTLFAKLIGVSHRLLLGCNHRFSSSG